MQASRLTRLTAKVVSSPTLKGLWRATKSTLPLLVGLGAGVGTYYVNQDFRLIVDTSKEALNSLPGGSELATSAFTMGLAPDFLAQRYAGSRFNWSRLAGMTVVGAISGRVLLRPFYNLQDLLFPAQEQFSLLKKILVDQAIYTPLYFCGFYLPATNFIHRRPWHGFSGTLWPSLVNVLPKNWVYWGSALTVVYNLSSDSRIYAANAFALIWFSFLSNYTRHHR